jgi:hypothetical protein
MTSRIEYIRTYNLPKLQTITIAVSLLVPHDDSLSAFDPALRLPPLNS